MELEKQIALDNLLRKQEETANMEVGQFYKLVQDLDKFSTKEGREDFYGLEEMRLKRYSNYLNNKY